MPSSFAAAADTFLQHEGAGAPDFSASRIVVPHHHAAQGFRQALREALPGRYLLPPRLLTLPELAAQAPLADAPEADSLRLAQLRDFLDDSGQLPRDSLWDAARELLILVNELDAEGCDLTGRSSGFSADNRYLTLEAGIARAVWRALGQGAGQSRMRQHAARLAWLAERADGPLYLLNANNLSAVERQFLTHWRDRASLVELPAPPGNTARQALLETAWEHTAGAELPTRAQAFAERHPASPLDPDVRVIAAVGLEAAAQAAEQTLLNWLGAGLRNIALVAPDRLMARRLRALLERRGILVQDETGWAFSTASVSHVLERWLRLVSNDAGFRDLLDLLKSPYVFADMTAQRLRAAHDLDEAFRRHGPPDGLAGHLALARREGLSDAVTLLLRIERARIEFTGKRQPLREWNRRLLEALAMIGAEAPLRADPVGAQMLTLLETLARDCAGHGKRYGLADWRRWLFLHLEQATFSDTTVKSPLRMTHLAAAHSRDLEGAIVLGVGAAHLPGAPPTGLFNDATRARLGLPGTREREQSGRAALADLLARTPRVTLLWQTEENGDPTPLSPWLAHLDAFHRAAWGRSLIRQAAAETPAPAETDGAATAPRPHAEQMPARLSVSAWQSLVSCPYQFFARHLLHLNERDEAPEEMDKADYGSLVHRILARFHDAHPVLLEHDATALRVVLLAIGREVFATAETRGYLVRAWLRRWERHADSYLAWAIAREQAGYQFQAGETKLARAPAEGVVLEGRVDRIDARPGTRAVLDYKTQSRATLKAKLDTSAEDVQLTAYAWLARADEAGFVTLDADKVETLAWHDDLPAAAEAEAERLREVLAGVAAGAELPARGARKTCVWCEMRGLCRRDHWDDDPARLPRPGT